MSQHYAINGEPVTAEEFARRVATDPGLTMTSAEWLGALADAWHLGYSTCLGDFDIAARGEARSSNPYRVKGS